MGSLNPEDDSKQELNDSGCVQDASVTESYKGQAQLLDLSDDVLLYILKVCTPMDLKALGHTCPRLGRLVCDRTLWQHVDARDKPTGLQRLQWLLTHCLAPSTQELKLSGYVNRETRCLGIQELTWPEGETSQGEVEHYLLRMWYPHLPRYAMSPRWPDKREAEFKAYTSSTKSKLPLGPLSQLASQIVAGTPTPSDPIPNAPNAPSAPNNEGTSLNNRPEPQPKVPKDARRVEIEKMAAQCSGPQFTVNEKLLKMLRMKCRNLTALSLDYCNLDYRTTNPRYLPPKLTKLSLKGTRCYNLPLNMSFLGKIQESLPGLEYLDISECDWLEPASLMALSKLPVLRQLYMRQCVRLTECVAYASLATRYGFQQLKILDLRGSPVADSEVSAFGWLPILEELYVSPPYHVTANMDHSHKWEDQLAPFCELDDWETEVPDYYKCKTPPPEEMEEEEEDDEQKDEISKARLGDVMVGNYVTCTPLERRIIVISQNNDNRDNSHDLIPEILRAHGYRAPEHNPGPPRPSAGPSKRRRSDNGEDLAKRPRKDKKASPAKENESADQDMATPGPSNSKTASPGPSNSKTANPGPSNSNPVTPGPSNSKAASPGSSDETPGPSRSNAASNEASNEPENRPRNREYRDLSYELYSRHFVDLLARDLPNHIQNIDPIDPVEIPIIPGPVYRHHRRRPGQARPAVYLQNPAPEVPDNVYRRRIFQPIMHIDVDLNRQNHHLVSDSAVLRFGRAENENVNYVHIGHGYNPNPNANGFRPDQASLKILSITGFNNVTDRSLEHLATAAPHLTHIDFRYTSVTARGVALFKAIRPNCEVVFGET